MTLITPNYPKPLPHRLIQHDPGGDTDVERVEIGCLRDFYHRVGHFLEFWVDALAFRTHEDGGGHGEICLENGFGTIAQRRGNHLYARLLQHFHRAEHAADPAYPDPGQGAGGGFHGFLIGRGRAGFRHHYGMHTRTFRRTADGAEVAHVGNAVEQHEQRIFTLFEDQGQYVFYLLKLYHCQVRDHTLMCALGHFVQFFARHDLERDAVLFRQVPEFFLHFPADTLLEIYFFYCFPGADGLRDGVVAVYQICVCHDVAVGLVIFLAKIIFPGGLDFKNLKITLQLKVISMSENNHHLEHLAEIRALMERSTRFLSLSGLSGVWAGFCALVGVSFVYAYLEVKPFSGKDEYYYYYYDKAMLIDKWGMDYKSVFILIAIMVLAAALAGGWFFTARKARLRGERVWDASSRRLLTALAIPLVTGGVFCLALMYRSYVDMLAPSTLIFYGLALVNGSKFTLRDVELLGILEIALGLYGVFNRGSGLEVWAFGFGFLHIFYGLWMYWKYEKG